MLPDMPYAGIPVPACLKVVVFSFMVVITYEKQRNYAKLRICLTADTQYLWRVHFLSAVIDIDKVEISYNYMNINNFKTRTL